jgi:hypothetical protein
MQAEHFGKRLDADLCRLGVAAPWRMLALRRSQLK